MSRLLPAIAGALLAAALLASPASAQLVFDRGNDIWAANDDGSSPHPLVEAAPLGMDAGLGSPAVAPDGNALLFRGTTLRNPHAGFTTNFYGENADGDYVLSGGVVRRLSAPPAAMPLSLTTGDMGPEPAPAGGYVYQHDSCTEAWNIIVFGYVPFCVSELRSSSLAAGAAGSARFASPCDEEAEGGPADPSPNPASGTLQIAYVGCKAEAEFSSPGELIVGGPGGAATPIAVGPELPNDESVAGFADFADPSWSPDGSRIVAYDYGGTDTGGNPEQAAGIYAFDPARPGFMRLMAAAPRESNGEYEVLASPRFAGAETIVFVARGSVWSVPADCSECSFPGDARRLFAGGSDPSTQAFSVAWTAREVVPATAYPGQGATAGPAQQAGAAPTAKHPGQPGEAGEGSLALRLDVLHPPRLRRLLARGLPVRVRCSHACRLALSLTIRAGTARRYGLLGSRHRERLRGRLAAPLRLGATVIGRARLRLRAGRLTAVRVRLTHRAAHALRRAQGLRLRLVALARSAGVPAASAARSVRVRP